MSHFGGNTMAVILQFAPDETGFRYDKSLLPDATGGRGEQHKYQRAVMKLQQLREANAGLLATIEQINEASVDLDPYRLLYQQAIRVS